MIYYIILLSLCRGEFGHGLGALRDGVLGKLTGKNKAHGGLNLAARQGGLVVVGAEFACLSCNLSKDIVDE